MDELDPRTYGKLHRGCLETRAPQIGGKWCAQSLGLFASPRLSCCGTYGLS